jgi:hypothetical protein
MSLFKFNYYDLKRSNLILSGKKIERKASLKEYILCFDAEDPRKYVQRVIKCL